MMWVCFMSAVPSKGEDLDIFFWFYYIIVNGKMPTLSKDLFFTIWEFKKN